MNGTYDFLDNIVFKYLNIFIRAVITIQSFFIVFYHSISQKIIYIYIYSKLKYSIELFAIVPIFFVAIKMCCIKNYCGYLMKLNTYIQIQLLTLNHSAQSIKIAHCSSNFIAILILIPILYN